ncbi:SpoIIE family protein phosphatase [Azospirillum sp.]|uniref:SpoIIE family protein phosphatase n=1 Tax=Azospirillum sp. TaxID=34012 RepID=UPI002D4CD494|nr:SpoIIE family protein phosphatase [Azospirillum sp.]HYD71222.1 SpoIIE family protein phosphatase [Azospirillum sp.]
MVKVRFGVANRLTAGLIGLTLLTVLAAAVALYGTAQFRQGFDQIALTRFSQLIGVAKLAQQSQIIAATAPRIVASTDRFELDRQVQHARDLFVLLDAAFAEVERTTADKGQLAALARFRPQMEENLRRLADLVADRLEAERRLLADINDLDRLARDARRAQDRTAEVLTARIEFLVGQTDDGTLAQLASAIESLRLGTNDVSDAVDTMLRVSAVTTPAPLGRMESEARALLQRARSSARELAPALADNLLNVIDGVAARSEGDGSIFAARRRQLELANRTQGLLAQNNLVIGQFVSTVSRQFSELQGEIAAERGDFSDFIGTAFNALLAIIAVAVLAALLVFLYVRSRVVRRLSELQQCMTANAEGRAMPVPVGGPDEIADDEIADMGRAFQHFVDEVALREAELARKSAQLEAAMMAMPNAIIMTDRYADVVLYNQRYREVWRNTPEGELAGRPFRDLLESGARAGNFGDAETAGAVGAVLAAMRDGAAMHHEQPLPDGRTVLVQGNAERDGGYVFTYTDITGQKRTQAALHDAKDEAERALERLAAAHAELNRANASINEGIRYARRIQLALLPGRNAHGGLLEDIAVAWQPLDAVGGDYYWIGEIDGRCIVAVMDCTGHGVPGAFMTAIVASALTRILQDHGDDDPARILALMNALVRKALRQDVGGDAGGDAGDADRASNDGLDAAICVIDPAARRLSFAGANLPLLYHADGELHVIKGNRHSLGYRDSRPDFAFQRHDLTLRPGMRFYLFTDGIVDQVGGPSRRLFGRRRLQDALRGTAGLPMDRQLDHLLDTLAAYRDGEGLRDDLTFIGFVPRVRAMAEEDRPLEAEAAE